MSLNPVPLETVSTLAPITRVSEQRKFAILRAPSLVNYQVWNSSSFSTASISWSAPPPSIQTLVCRKVLMSVDFALQFNAPNASAAPTLPLLQLGAGIDGLRAFPLSSVISTLQFTINGAAVSVQIADVISPYVRLNNANKQTLDGEYSVCPSYPDQAQDWSQTYGTNRNPFALYGSNPY